MVFYRFLDLRGIDFDSRLQAGTLLSLGEIEELARLCRIHLDDFAFLSGPSVGPTPKVQSLEKARMELQQSAFEEVDPGVAASRLRYIRMYIEWLAEERSSRQALPGSVAIRLTEASRHVSKAIDSRIPSHSGRGPLGQREGAPDEVVDEMLRAIDPRCPDNPWRDEHTRCRNALLIHWLLYLGVRIGEALGVRVSDINVRATEVTIHRRADDPGDPRAYPPQTKTLARVLTCSDALLQATQNYILQHRRSQGDAKKHSFLFVASRTGQPMSLSAVGKMFRVLREACPALPANLSAHLLRHTWNDVFSKKMETQHVGHEDEQKIRSYLMGWSPTSGTAATYTRRYVRMKAREASLDLQNKIMGGRGNQ
jgi:integrase